MDGILQIQENKGKFVYSSLPSPRGCSKRCFSGRRVKSNTISTSLGSIQEVSSINQMQVFRNFQMQNVLLKCKLKYISVFIY